MGNVSGIYRLADRKGLHLDISSGSNLRSRFRLAERIKKKQHTKQNKNKSHYCIFLEKKGQSVSPFASPASHEESSQQAVTITGTNLVLVQQLISHLLSHHGQTAGVQVEDDRA